MLFILRRFGAVYLMQLIRL